MEHERVIIEDGAAGSGGSGDGNTAKLLDLSRSLMYIHVHHHTQL
jgi:hypothetical protein